MDARSQAARVVINYYLESVVKPANVGGSMWVSLLNLGKLNYFHKKTATGDQALGLAAEVIRRELVGTHVPFKHNGSDFYILTAGMTKNQIAEYKKVLEEKLNSNKLLDEIFLQEIAYIERTEQDSQVRNARIDEVRKLMVHKFKVY